MSTVLHGYESDPGPDTDSLFVHTGDWGCKGDCGQKGGERCPHPGICSGVELRTDLRRVTVDVPLKQPRVWVDAKPLAVDKVSREDVQRAQRLIRRERFLRHAVPWIAAIALILAAMTVTMNAAHAADAETTATIAAGADTVSTVAAVGSGMAVESNGLIANPPVFLAVSALKIMAPRLTRDMEPENRRTTLRTMSTVWGGAAANNLAILAGVGCPLCVGVAVGVWLWVDSGKPATPEPVAAPEAGAALAMVQQ